MMTDQFPNLDISEVWRDEGFIIVKPRIGVGKLDAESSAIWQAQGIAAQVPALVEHYGIKTVWWDTITATARNCYDNFANISGGSVAFKAGDFKVLQSDWTNYGKAQTLIRSAVRKQLVNPPGGRNYHLWCTLHTATRSVEVGRDGSGNPIKQAVEMGPDAGGPSTVGDWGKEFSYVWRVYTVARKTGVKRYLQLDTMLDGKIEIKARTASGMGVVPTFIEIPSTFDGSVEAVRKALAYGGFDPSNPAKYGYVGGTVHGNQGVGKTLLTSAFLGLANTKPCLYIAADGDAEYLRSMWAEVKVAP